MLNWVIQFLFHINDLYVTEENVTKKEMNKDLKADSPLGLDDFTIWKCFSAIFPLKKKTIQFPLSLNLYFQQKRAPICKFATYLRNALFEFLARSCTLFWKYS